MFVQRVCRHMEEGSATDRRLPVTIITGFLGSGKTTLLNRILREQHGLKIAVILNEIGDVNLDGELVSSELSSELKIMNNGCVCCTVRGDLLRGALDLIQRKVPFDHLMIETTGMADPLPVAQTFLLEPSLSSHYRLDAVLSVVDAQHFEQNLATCAECISQVGFADVLLLNKKELISDDGLAHLTRHIRSINGAAKIFPTTNCEVSLQEIMDIDAFNPARVADFEHHSSHGFHEHHHDEAIESLYLEEDSPLELEKLNSFMSIIVQELGTKILRSKGVVHVAGEENRIVFQGVHQNFGSTLDRPWREDEKRITRMVFIGRYLPADVLREGLRLCRAK